MIEWAQKQTTTGSEPGHNAKAVSYFPAVCAMATAQPPEVPGAWLKVADCTVFQLPVQPGGGTN